MRSDHRTGAGQGGFTLVELLAVVTIVSIVLALAAPNFSTFAANQRLRNASSDLMLTLLAARSEAIKRNAEVTVSAAVTNGTPDWGRGWTATAPGGVEIDRKDMPAGTVEGAALQASIVFDGSGRITTAGGASIELRDGRGDAAVSPRCVAIDLSGRPHLSVGTCS